MEEAKRTDVNELGEFGLIDHLTKDLVKVNASTVLGVGDDAAIIQCSEHLTLVTTDMLVEGIHFDLIYTPLKHLGYKSVVVNLSDIYAMNGIPEQITVSIALSNRFSVEALEELYAGIRKACEVYGVDLIGGDTTSSNKGLIISITAIGKVHESKVVRRNGAKVGDLICVSGDLGGSYIGMQLMEREKRLFLSNAIPEFKADFEGQTYLVGRQLLPEARKDIIGFFYKADIVPTAMIDISDGLSSEIMHICKQSGVGAYIEEENVPIHLETQQMAIKFNMDPITAALSGGEDYELLFTLDPKDVEKIRFLNEIAIIGEIIPAEDGVKLHTTGGNIRPIIAQGWKHFG